MLVEATEQNQLLAESNSGDQKEKVLELAEEISEQLTLVVEFLVKLSAKL